MQTKVSTNKDDFRNPCLITWDQICFLTGVLTACDSSEILSIQFKVYSKYIPYYFTVWRISKIFFYRFNKVRYLRKKKFFPFGFYFYFYLVIVLNINPATLFLFFYYSVRKAIITFYWIMKSIFTRNSKTLYNLTTQ